MRTPITPTISDRVRSSLTTNGFLVLPDLVPAGTIEALRAEADTVLRQRLSLMVTTRTPDPRVTWWRLASGHPYVLKIKPVVDLAPTVAAVADDLRAVITDLIGPAPRLMENKFMYKQVVDIAAGWAGLPVLGEEVRKHTDAAYFSARGYQRVLTVALCLDPCTTQTGALRVWPGSHRRTINMTATDNQGPVVLDAEAPDDAAVTLVATPGSVLAWDSALVHASGPNTSGRPRRLLVLGYAPGGPRCVS
jgi:Phytanoyl-CoA dioxygenase (PhyH)